MVQSHKVPKIVVQSSVRIINHPRRDALRFPALWSWGMSLKTMKLWWAVPTLHFSKDQRPIHGCRLLTVIAPLGE